MSAEQPLSSDPNTSLRKPVRKAFVSRAARIPMLADAAARQGRAATIAWEAFGDRDTAVAYLNTRDDALGGRPIDIAIASASGLTAVEASVTRVRLERCEVVKIQKLDELVDEPSENPDRGRASPSVTDPAIV
jgi:hypothetical protein